MDLPRLDDEFLYGRMASLMDTISRIESGANNGNMLEVGLAISKLRPDAYVVFEELHSRVRTVYEPEK